MIALGNLHVGDRVLVCFNVSAAACDPRPPNQEMFPNTWSARVFKERRVLGIDLVNREIVVLDYHLEPSSVPYDWLREVPAE